mgnify:CR=1 FL=1
MANNAISWEKNIILKRYIEKLKVKEKRRLFFYLRGERKVDEDTFVPYYGITFGEFSVYHLLDSSRRRT